MQQYVIIDCRWYAVYLKKKKNLNSTGLNNEPDSIS